MKKINIGFALCGSFCTFSEVLPEMKNLADEGHNIIPIMSFNAFSTDTRFGKAQEFRSRIEDISNNKIIATINEAEPIGPKKLLDILIIEPCTGNTLAKLANGIADTPVTLAAKSHLRNSRPVLIAVSSNDALAGAAKNIGHLMNYKNVFFVPLRQDDHINKPASVVADFTKTSQAMYKALENIQMQPLLTEKR
ncbi:MAG: dipicolinate synthase subunit B [Ruminococcaceae bacterium]|nr:dipicolinate synthase subunit B [Oscillospiraceae bacterium]MBR3595844.1 dipicolinate synthase subunit B [Clostridia bacterium]